MSTFNAAKGPERWRHLPQRLHYQLGSQGYAGLVLILISLAVLAHAWFNHSQIAVLRARAQIIQSPLGSTLAEPQIESKVARPADLPKKADQVQLLAAIEQAAQRHHLAWTKVDYALTHASDAALTSLEVRGTIKGSYPALRSFVADALNEQPALALRTLTLQRDQPESVDVEARIALVIYMADGWTNKGTP